MLLSGTLLIFTPDMVTALNLTVGLSDQDVRSKNAITCSLGLEVVGNLYAGELSIGATVVLSACAPRHTRTPVCTRADAHRFRECPKTIVSSEALTTFQLYVLILLIK
jgi:hypothetical protein